MSKLKNHSEEAGISMAVARVAYEGLPKTTSMRLCERCSRSFRKGEGRF